MAVASTPSFPVRASPATRLGPCLTRTVSGTVRTCSHEPIPRPTCRRRRLHQYAGHRARERGGGGRRRDRVLPRRVRPLLRHGGRRRDRQARCRHPHRLATHEAVVQGAGARGFDRRRARRVPLLRQSAGGARFALLLGVRDRMRRGPAEVPARVGPRVGQRVPRVPAGSHDRPVPCELHSRVPELEQPVRLESPLHDRRQRARRDDRQGLHRRGLWHGAASGRDVRAHAPRQFAAGVHDLSEQHQRRGRRYRAVECVLLGQSDQLRVDQLHQHRPPVHGVVARPRAASRTRSSHPMPQGRARRRASP